jgi:hypothetical protein
MGRYVGQGEDDGAADGDVEGAGWVAVVPGSGVSSATGWDSGETWVAVGLADGDDSAAADD